MIDFLLKAINWKLISILGKSKIVNKSMVFLFVVPIIAKVISKVDKDLTFKIFNQKIDIVLQLPFNWKMLFSQLFCLQSDLLCINYLHL